MKKKITMEQFCACIPWQQIEMVMGKREYNKFVKWMYGQTVPFGGVYPWDLEGYLKGYKPFD